jgi:hypothetical protein
MMPKYYVPDTSDRVAAALPAQMGLLILQGSGYGQS